MSKLSPGSRPLLLIQAGLAGVAITTGGVSDRLRNHTPPPVTGSNKARRMTQPRVKIRILLAQPSDDWDD
jgi:hypothetical protein